MERGYRRAARRCANSGHVMDLETPGQRIARARRRRGLSQAVLAGLVGRSESWLSQVERGKRGIDSHAVLTRLAEVLRIDIEQITRPDAGAEDGWHMYPAAALIEQAMMRYGTLGASADPEPEPDRQMGHLRAMARSAYLGYQATRYEATGHPSRRIFSLATPGPQPRRARLSISRRSPPAWSAGARR